MAGSQIPSSVTILNSLKGYQALSLTEFSTSALSQIAAGSVVEIGGAFFNFPADEVINASTWGSIVSGNTAYIALVPAGTAGSQTVTAEFVSTDPVWRDDSQGWYASAASTTRVIASVYKLNATSQIEKLIFNGMDSQGGRHQRIYLTSGTFLVPANIVEVYLTGCAAGGNGGNGDDGGTNDGGGGGGAGEIIYRKKVLVTASSSIVVTIGAVGMTTSFGATVLNFGLNGQAGSAGGAGGAGGALGFGSTAGASGGFQNTSSTVSTIAPSGVFAVGGGGGLAYTAGGTGGGGGAGGIGIFAGYSLATNGASGSFSGGLAGAGLGGGGGGGYGNGISAGNGGNGGYGSGGGGGGGNDGVGTGGTGGAGGPAILIVEW